MVSSSSTPSREKVVVGGDDSREAGTAADDAVGFGTAGDVANETRCVLALSDRASTNRAPIDVLSLGLLSSYLGMEAHGGALR